MSSTGRMKHSASCLMGLLCAALTMVGLFTPRTANGQTVYEGTIYSFSELPGDGSNPSPYMGLIMDSQGNLYGTTWGTPYAFELVNNSGTYSEKIFPTPAGTNAGLVMDSQGNLYGTSQYGGNGYGTVFELVNHSGSYSPATILYSFTYNSATPGMGDGLTPYAGLIVDSRGNLYGTTTAGGAYGYGTVFELVNKAGVYSEVILHSFNTGGDGLNPFAGLIMDSQANLYGTTASGGADGWGAVFELQPTSSGAYSETVLYSFSSTGGDGQRPFDGLIMDGQGNFYGTTNAGGANGYGAVFELVKNSNGYAEQVLYSFSSTGGDGQNPIASPIMDSQGNLYGTTDLGGAGGFGTVFELVKNSGAYSEQILYSFPAPSPTTTFGLSIPPPPSPWAFNPVGRLFQSPSGVIYGTAQGGFNYYGSVFELAVPPSGATPYSTTTSLTCSPNSFNPDAPAPVQCTAVVTSSSAPQGLAIEDGSVSFYYGTTALGTSPVSNATATLSYSSNVLADGTTPVTAQYTPASKVFAASSGQAIMTLTEPGVATTNGSNTFNGNQAVNGTLTATAFTGNGSGLTGVLASGLSTGATISGSQVTGTVASATTAASLTGNISDMQVINLAADLASASASAVSTANAYAKGTFLPLTGGTLTGPLNGTSASWTGALTGASAKFNGPVAIGGGTPISEYISVVENVGPLGALSSGTCTTLQTPALTGFTPGANDTIALGVPSSLTTNLGSGIFLIYQAWETSPGPSPTITIQVCNPSGARYKGGASGVIRIDFFKH
jgi:uncharacterized repeat protein (TIGR03803 family)